MDCFYQSSFSTIKCRLNGSEVPRFRVQGVEGSEVLAAGFSLLAAGREQLTAYQLPGARDQQPDAKTFKLQNLGT